MTYDGKSYKREKFKEIVSEQVMLGYLTKGGVTYGDTDNMSPYERRIAVDTIREFLDESNRRQAEAMKGVSHSGPKSRATSK